MSFRITSEVGPAPFTAFRTQFEHRYGVQRIGVSQHGRPVVRPPDWPMFSFDVVRMVASALDKTTGSSSVLGALDSTVISGANGDERGYGPTQHEGVNPSDMYFARFSGFTFQPVTDDPLSEALPTVNQLG